MVQLSDQYKLTIISILSIKELRISKGFLWAIQVVTYDNNVCNLPILSILYRISSLYYTLYSRLLVERLAFGSGEKNIEKRLI